MFPKTEVERTQNVAFMRSQRREALFADLGLSTSRSEAKAESPNALPRQKATTPDALRMAKWRAKVKAKCGTKARSPNALGVSKVHAKKKAAADKPAVALRQAKAKKSRANAKYRAKAKAERP